MAKIQNQFTNVTVLTKANIYFEGKVVSHTVQFADGSKKTIGLIYPGNFHFGTQAAERMEISAGQAHWKEYATGQLFEVPANSGFDIEVKTGICEYVCSFLS